MKNNFKKTNKLELVFLLILFLLSLVSSQIIEIDSCTNIKDSNYILSKNIYGWVNSCFTIEDNISNIEIDCNYNSIYSSEYSTSLINSYNYSINNILIKNCNFILSNDVDIFLGNNILHLNIQNSNTIFNKKGQKQSKNLEYSLIENFEYKTLYEGLIQGELTKITILDSFENPIKDLNVSITKDNININSKTDQKGEIKIVFDYSGQYNIKINKEFDENFEIKTKSYTNYYEFEYKQSTKRDLYIKVITFILILILTIITIRHIKNHPPHP